MWFNIYGSAHETHDAKRKYFCLVKSVLLLVRLQNTQAIDGLVNQWHRLPTAQVTDGTGYSWHRQPVAQATDYIGYQRHRLLMAQATDCTGYQQTTQTTTYMLCYLYIMTHRTGTSWHRLPIAQAIHGTCYRWQRLPMAQANKLVCVLHIVLYV